MVRVSKYGISVKDFDTYEEYKREYDKVRRIKDKDKLKEYNKNRDYKEQYQKRKAQGYTTKYYQDKRNANPEWVEQQKIKCKEYKQKNKKTLAEKTAEYKKTYQGKKSHKTSEWKTKHGLKETPERIDEIFDRWFHSTHCELCNKPYKNTKQRCMEHNHDTGHFRCICCVSCNNYISSMDRQRHRLMLELHRRFNLH